MKALRFAVLVGLLLLQAAAGQGQPTAPRPWGEWTTWGDQGQGTYQNPVLPADYSDVDCIRVGEDYYAISSTFQFSPGMVVLHSRDLVNWTIQGHVISDLTQIGPELSWNRMNRTGKGVWAGAIRHHDGKFWVYFGTPDEGYFMSTAPTAAGPWTALHPVLKAAGWDDCCPFWDEDGQGYLVGTNFRDGYKIHLFRLTADGRDLVPESDRVIYQSKGSEASKLYKINGYYCHLFSEVKPEGRALMMERARHIYGPYEPARQLSHAEKANHEPNQGGLVQTPQGDWYFLTHHGSGGDWSGRILSLLPVTWQDGYPILGAVGPDGIGTMAWAGKKPLPNAPVVTPQTSDDFTAATLGPQWEWNYQPRPGKWSLTEKRGHLRLHAFPPLEPDNLLKAGNTLTQRSMRTRANEAVVRIDLRGMADGQQAGLCHFGSPKYASLGVVSRGSARILEFSTGQDTTPGPVLKGKSLWLKSTWGLDGKSQYSYSLNGKTYTPFGTPYQLVWGAYRGDRIGLYSYNNKAEAGYVDVDFFHYEHSGPSQ
ncbi:MAG TPA: glycoside hydrolase 43 family protein [Hymenobacter sp.]|jgi:beta-xylosidase|uniref:glycoside hydrolase family 43 protein n=1 Tax=Hymenobacter sp. TaxID=1898978 RepID=UPI002ED809C2